MLDQIAREQGFKDAEEMNSMICAVDLTHKPTHLAFLAWKQVDGTKAGLQTVLEIKEEGDGATK